MLNHTRATNKRTELTVLYDKDQGYTKEKTRAALTPIGEPIFWVGTSSQKKEDDCTTSFLVLEQCQNKNGHTTIV